MLVQQHLRLIEYTAPARLLLTFRQAGLNVAPRDFRSWRGDEPRCVRDTRVPAFRPGGEKRNVALREMGVECIHQLPGFIGRYREARCIGQHHAVCVNAEVHRIGAQPAVLARLAALSAKRERGKRKLPAAVHAETGRQPAFGRAGLDQSALAAGHKRFQRRQLEFAKGRRVCKRGPEQMGDEQVAIHRMRELRGV